MSRRPARRRRAFTLVELLVSIAVVALLIGILGAVLAGAFRSGRQAAVEQQLASIGFALEQFKNDFGYYPPLLNDDPASLEDGADDRFTVVDGLDTQGQPRLDELYEARWHSIFSLPVYLVGVGDLAPASFQPDNPGRHDGADGPGLRDPGPDKAWGGALRRTFEGEYRTHRPPTQGRVYGPYMDIANASQSFRVARGEDFRVYDGRPDDAAAWDEIQRNPTLRREVFVFVDRWDRPIRYYRDWPTREPVDRNDPTRPRKASLERVPVELLKWQSVSRRATGEPIDTDADADMLRAPYALLSAGPDGLYADAPFARDTEGSGNTMDEEFSNAAKIDELTPTQRKDLEKSLRDNVRYTP